MGLKTLPPSCANCHEIGEPQPLEPSGPVQGLLYLFALFMCVRKFTI